MAHDRTTRVRATSRIANMFPDGKKAVLAIGLVAVMAVMWIRVLIGHKPVSASASVPSQKATASNQGEPAPKVKMIDVPRIPGRSDSIGRDCFKMQDRVRFRQSVPIQNTSTDTEVPVVLPHHDEEVIQQVAQTLKLEAVLRNGTPYAFLSDRLLKAGDRFRVERGADVFEFEVLRIDEDAVLVECHDIQLTLKLAQYVDVRK